jgi:hypothetical protein
MLAESARPFFSRAGSSGVSASEAEEARNERNSARQKERTCHVAQPKAQQTESARNGCCNRCPAGRVCPALENLRMKQQQTLPSLPRQYMCSRGMESLLPPREDK